MDSPFKPFEITGAIVRAGPRSYGPFATVEAAVDWMNNHGHNFARPQSVEVVLDGFVFAREALRKPKAA